ncbi:3'-5' exonuclease [Geoglobus acetivorans]|uniref:DNA polymerase III epsilon subunit n=1 Tax=Geoglobus acetivorans TaxID=565033 RepID=A0A0A7GES7_GEOAI|nr:DNA polymerase III epsilon subunit [Geoglobus acetivorans]
MREEKFVVVDVETTGLNMKKDRIISIAMIPMDGLRIQMNDVFTAYIRPENVDDLSIASAKYHGIIPKDIEDAPDFCSLSHKIEEMLQERIVVGHGITIDIEFLEKEFKNCGKHVKIERFLDIAMMERVIGEIFGERPKNEDLTLEALARKYNVEMNYRHSALADALIEAHIFQIQVMRLIKYGINTFEALNSFIQRVGLDKGSFTF